MVSYCILLVILDVLKPPKKKFKINVELLATYIASEWNPPRKASCLDGGYWHLAAKFCTSSK